MHPHDDPRWDIWSAMGMTEEEMREEIRATAARIESHREARLAERPAVPAAVSESNPNYRSPLYKPGTDIICTCVDSEGLTGRDPHPEDERKGMTGKVIGLVDSEWMGCPEDPDRFLLHFYAVRFDDDAAVRIMAEFEIEED